MEQALPRRDPALDAVRALAIILVLVIHAASAGFSFPVGSFDWWGALAWGALARPAVPLFFLCSGALMLGRDIPLKRLYGHNLLRIVLAMWFWAFLYQLYHLLPGGLTPAGLWEAVKHTLLLHHEFHFYFLHIMLLVYVFLPVTRVFTRHACRRELEYFLAVWFVTGILFPLLKNFWPFSLVYAIPTRYLLNSAYSSIGYGVLGWYLRQYGGTIPRRWYLLAFAGGLAFTFGGTAAASLRAGTLAEMFLEGWSPGPMLMAAGLFGLLLGVKRWPEPLRRFTVGLSRASFCVYLVHVFFLYILQSLGVTASAGLPLLSIPGVSLLLLTLSWLVYGLLSRIPVVKTYLI